MKKLSIVAVLIAGLALPLFAQTADDAPVQSKEYTFNGTVPNKNTVEIIDMNVALDDLQENDHERAVLKYRINNNNPAGYTIRFHSDNGGRLFRVDPSDGNRLLSSNLGDWIKYNILTQDAGGIHFGAANGATYADYNVTDVYLDKDLVIPYLGNEAATVDYDFELLAKTQAKPTLFRGKYKDTITLTITDK